MTFSLSAGYYITDRACTLEAKVLRKLVKPGQAAGRIPAVFLDGSSCGHL
jgi:hypothetical protein